MQLANLASYTDPLGAKIFLGKDLTAGIARWRASAISTFVTGQPVLTFSYRPASAKSAIHRYRVSGRLPTIDSNGLLLRSAQFDLDCRFPEQGTQSERDQLLYMLCSLNHPTWASSPGAAMSGAEGIY